LGQQPQPASKPHHQQITKHNPTLNPLVVVVLRAFSTTTTTKTKTSTKNKPNSKG